MTATAPGVEIGKLDATGQAALVAAGDVTPRQLIEFAIERIDAMNPCLNAVVTTAYEHALAAADGGPTGPFAGVPMLCKDLVLELPGLRFTEGSRFLRDNVSSIESELAARYRRAGLVALGKTNTPEFGMSPSCEPVLFGPTRNPWNVACSTSGSSGGSAAAVAAGLVAVAHGNDVGGSIRYPASACGVFGLKPTRARNPLGPIYGDIVGGMACEHVLTRSVRDSAAVLDATAGPSAGDPYPAPPRARPYVAEVGTDPGRLRIGFSRRTPEGPPGHPDCLAGLDETTTSSKRSATTSWRSRTAGSTSRSPRRSAPSSTSPWRGSSRTGCRSWVGIRATTISSPAHVRCEKRAGRCRRRRT